MLTEEIRALVRSEVRRQIREELAIYNAQQRRTEELRGLSVENGWNLSDDHINGVAAIQSQPVYENTVKVMRQKYAKNGSNRVYGPVVTSGQPGPAEIKKLVATAMNSGRSFSEVMKAKS